MTVRKIKTTMPAAELSGWLAHFKLSAEEQERARKKAEAKRGRG